MSTLTRVETGRDARGNLYQTKVYKGFEALTPSNSATSYTLTHEDGVYTLSETFTENVPDPGGGAGSFPDIWSLDVSTITEAMESNLYFKNGMTLEQMGWWTAWKMGRDAEKGKIYPIDGFPGSGPSTSAVVQQIYERFNRGETDYLSPRVVVKLQRVYATPPNLGGTGYATGNIPGCPFSFRSDVNFLQTGATAVTEGNLFRVTLEWLVSKPGNWDILIYGS
jgi:hypothetical protein